MVFYIIILLATVANSASPVATSSTVTTASAPTTTSASDYASDAVVMEMQESRDVNDIPEVPLPAKKVLNSLVLLNHLKDLVNKNSTTKEQKIQI